MTESALENHLIILQCDWGEETPIWIDGYPVDLEETSLSAPLVAGLKQWASDFVMNKTEQGGYDWIPTFDAAKFDSDGARLAEDLAVELGSRWVIRRLPGDLAEDHRSNHSPANVEADRRLTTWPIAPDDKARPNRSSLQQD